MLHLHHASSVKDAVGIEPTPLDFKLQLVQESNL